MIAPTASAASAAPPAGLSRAHELNTEIFHLTRTMQVLKNNVASSGGDGVPWSTYLLLFHLIAGGPRRAGALAETACIDPSTVSRQVDWLVRMGLVERRADPSDGRATLLHATDAGVAVQQQMRAGRDRMMADVLRDWPQDDVRHLTRLMARLNENLAEELPGILAALQRRTAGGTDPHSLFAHSDTGTDRDPERDETRHPKDPA